MMRAFMLSARPLSPKVMLGDCRGARRGIESFTRQTCGAV
jgi:hypothetical protein